MIKLDQVSDRCTKLRSILFDNLQLRDLNVYAMKWPLLCSNVFFKKHIYMVSSSWIRKICLLYATRDLANHITFVMLILFVIV